MLRRLRLHNFKNFADAELSMGPLTLLVGANASGKSNLREALRFLHAVGRGYKLAEIFDEKWSAGELQWEGIRGGPREVSFQGAPVFGVSVDFDAPSMNGSVATERVPLRYAIDVFAGDFRHPARVEQESLAEVRSGVDGKDTLSLIWGLRHEGEGTWFHEKQGDELVGEYGWPPGMVGRDRLDAVVAPVLRSMRFIDLDTRAMRRSSTPGQTTLTDRGENLSSVLQTLCGDATTKEELVHWLRLLTPMDVTDMRFVADVRGHVILMIVEKDGHAYSAYSASDGTLRFLGTLAALFAPEPSLYFFEEIENGLHPTRVRLLIDLCEARARTGKVQIVATTHSPTVLANVHEGTLEHASLVYRIEGEPSSRISRLLDVPDAKRVLATHDRADLLASGWFEDMVEFASVPAEPVKEPPDQETAA